MFSPKNILVNANVGEGLNMKSNENALIGLILLLTPNRQPYFKNDIAD
jgi:hypothetical protein